LSRPEYGDAEQAGAGMFGWGRKSDGFDWHTHVRTTIKLRREDRRARLGDVREVAADGIKYAGRASMSAGSSGAVSAWNLCISAIQLLIEGASAGRQAVGQGVRKTAGQAQGALKASFVAWSKLAGQSPLLPIIGAVGLVAAHATYARILAGGSGAAAEVVLTCAIAVLALAAVLIPVLMGRVRLGALSANGLKMPSLSAFGLSGGQRRGAGIALALAAIAGGGYVASRAAPQTMASLASFRPFSLPPIEGRATMVTGDMIRVNTTTIRLAGIEAPDADQKCVGANKKKWACGEAARTALARVIKGKKVRCDLSGTDDQGRTLGVCETVGSGAGQGIAATLVKEGAVFSSGGIFSSLNALESEAREKKLGIWRGEAERPSEYRAKIWDTAAKAAPEGCPIKGQVSGSDKSYLLPWHADYSGTRIRTSRGERWFCSESEAQAAGWKVTGK
jgi:endonuclease YncB( thermonuclease family)